MENWTAKERRLLVDKVEKLEDQYTSIQEILPKGKEVNTHSTLLFLKRRLENAVIPLEETMKDGNNPNYQQEIVEKELLIQKFKDKKNEYRRLKRRSNDCIEKNIRQSHSLENYMDYNQKSNSSDINKAMKRKVFYKWQWDSMRKCGSENGYLKTIE